MKTVITLLFPFFLFLVTHNARAQSSSERVILGKENAKQELQLAFSDSLTSKSYYLTEVIKDSTSTINAIEHFLFNKFGRSKTLEECPYEIYHFESYWVVSGTLPKGMEGGTFSFVLNETNNKIIRLKLGQ